MGQGWLTVSSQGVAGGDEFPYSAALGSRPAHLSSCTNGRTSNPDSGNPRPTVATGTAPFPASEANAVINNFAALVGN